jgi:hypothetical protein
MDDLFPAKPNSARDQILVLARKHGVSYNPTVLDVLGNAMSRLADNDVHLDEPAQLLLTLRRDGHISHAEAARLHAAYLRAKYE